MENKTCKDCKHLNKELAFCRACGAKWLNDSDGANCKYFEKMTPPTNGDVIRQGSNRKLAEIFDDFYNGNKCKYCIHRTGSGACELNPTPYSNVGYIDAEDCLNGFEAWLNAPAKEGEEFVEPYIRWGEDGHLETLWRSNFRELSGMLFDTKEEAIAATVAKLKEVCEVKIYVVLRHDYYFDKDVIVFATADREYAKKCCEEKNQRKYGYHHYRVKGMKLKEEQSK